MLRTPALGALAPSVYRKMAAQDDKREQASLYICFVSFWRLLAKKMRAAVGVNEALACAAAAARLQHVTAQISLAHTYGKPLFFCVCVLFASAWSAYELWPNSAEARAWLKCKRGWCSTGHRWLSPPYTTVNGGAEVSMCIPDTRARVLANQGLCRHDFREHDWPLLPSGPSNDICQTTTSLYKSMQRYVPRGSSCSAPSVVCRMGSRVS